MGSQPVDLAGIQHKGEWRAMRRINGQRAGECPVSISNGYPEPAKQAIVNFYSSCFGGKEEARASEATATRFPGDCYEKDFLRLKEYLAYFDAKVPALYKQYTNCSSRAAPASWPSMSIYRSEKTMRLKRFRANVHY